MFAGDVDGDGLDILIGAEEGGVDEGRVYLMAADLGWGGEIELENASPFSSEVKSMILVPPCPRAVT